jgi:hypothetical protein
VIDAALAELYRSREEQKEEGGQEAPDWFRTGAKYDYGGEAKDYNVEDFVSERALAGVRQPWWSER